MRRSDSFPSATSRILGSLPSASLPSNSRSGDQPTSDESLPIYHPHSRSTTPNRPRCFSSLRVPDSFEENPVAGRHPTFPRLRFREALRRLRCRPLRVNPRP
ncbi:hypothetical protein LINPERPRIM_LOCUS9041 [Linum perenne]